MVIYRSESPIMGRIILQYYFMVKLQDNYLTTQREAINGIYFTNIFERNKEWDIFLMILREKGKEKGE